LNRILRRNDSKKEGDPEYPEKSRKSEFPAPIITSVRPAVVPVTGGVEIDIQGENFLPGLEVVIGGKKIPASKCTVRQSEGMALHLLSYL
jgi:hypothetical protein